MRCIETKESAAFTKVIESINYNMRCIETSLNKKTAKAVAAINYNMRCIETFFFIKCKRDPVG